MADEFVELSKGARSAAVQVGAAVVLVSAVMAAWGLGLFGDPSGGKRKAAVCEAPKATDSPGYPALCAALNRPDLPTLLGMPEEYVSVAYSGSGPTTFADGTKEDDPSARVQVGSVDVEITDYPHLSVKDFAMFSDSKAGSTSVLGRPAMTYSDHTLAITLGGTKAGSGTGGIARHLVVAKDPKGGDGSFEIAIWRQDSATPDEAALFRIAEQVLPTIHG
ncbi:DUF6215 domain-containing protein [Kitasatospora sp. McL0602]|uniref:DUF6215 domain-containing protein n=1 Tax=Kitasatospora sp. McL0602 TaxID=3439530 RepID=UPI003F8B1A0C